LIRTLRRSGLSYSQIAKITNASEGAIGAELAEWRKELAKQSRTIADEMADHAAEKIRKDAEPVIELCEPGGMDISQIEAPIELEIVR